MKRVQPEALFTYPLVTIDFEASALTLQSYPIEVGIAVKRTPGSAVESWASLIRPDMRWALNDQWDPDSERVHKIPRLDLQTGLTAFAIVGELNKLVPAESSVWCDGGHYDAHWLSELEAAAGMGG